MHRIGVISLLVFLGQNHAKELENLTANHVGKTVPKIAAASKLADTIVFKLFEKLDLPHEAEGKLDRTTLAKPSHIAVSTKCASLSRARVPAGSSHIPVRRSQLKAFEQLPATFVLRASRDGKSDPAKDAPAQPANFLERIKGALDQPILDANNREDQGPVAEALKKFVRDDPELASIVFSLSLITSLALLPFLVRYLSRLL
eukprot:gnl/TRDRNA2_/TRDRNA2_142022_c0_seq1.p1 gnl/TRDRNA2_/TRDRNA2_142022_c0~~gnl/TRDRNA2_/TRDRNA2_142022_c0_seq1.p1  ORF type:complete len:202 (-),score=26.18 gnl/TRDRNA2_/TRDRNA2_142022_c0_seq1:198-803(-)